MSRAERKSANAGATENYTWHYRRAYLVCKWPYLVLWMTKPCVMDGRTGVYKWPYQSLQMAKPGVMDDHTDATDDKIWWYTWHT